MTILLIFNFFRLCFVIMSQLYVNNLHLSTLFCDLFTFYIDKNFFHVYRANYRGGFQYE